MRKACNLPMISKKISDTRSPQKTKNILIEYDADKNRTKCVKTDQSMMFSE